MPSPNEPGRASPTPTPSKSSAVCLGLGAALDARRRLGQGRQNLAQGVSPGQYELSCTASHRRPHGEGVPA
ncbi:hypothetical protein SBA2_430018 [Acidobacteriia bacterium SbA2]|nr:hypothetical protein SBA2_430018 [Acidobacteriia bacterium SbA2]